MRRALLSGLFLVSGAGCAVPLQAQSPADSVTLARAAARRFLKPSPSDLETVRIWPLRSRFDSTLARMVAEESKDARVTADTLRVRPLGLRMVADTAFLTLEMEQCNRKHEGMNWWRETLDYLFVRTRDGWRFVAGRPLRNMDGSCSEDSGR